MSVRSRLSAVKKRIEAAEPPALGESVYHTPSKYWDNDPKALADFIEWMEERSSDGAVLLVPRYETAKDRERAAIAQQADSLSRPLPAMID